MPKGIFKRKLISKKCKLCNQYFIGHHNKLYCNECYKIKFQDDNKKNFAKWYKEHPKERTIIRMRYHNKWIIYGFTSSS